MTVCGPEDGVGFVDDSHAAGQVPGVFDGAEQARDPVIRIIVMAAPDFQRPEPKVMGE